MFLDERFLSIFDDTNGRFLEVRADNDTIHCTIRSVRKNQALAFRVNVKSTPKLSASTDTPLGITNTVKTIQIKCQLSDGQTFNDVMQPFVVGLQLAFLVNEQFSLVMHDTAIESLLNTSMNKSFHIIVTPRKLSGDPYSLTTSDLIVTSSINDNLLQYRLPGHETLCAFKILADIYTVLTNRRLLLAIKVKHTINPRTKREYTDDEIDADAEMNAYLENTGVSGDPNAYRDKTTFIDYKVLSQQYRNASLDIQAISSLASNYSSDFECSITPQLETFVTPAPISEYGVPFKLKPRTSSKHRYEQDHQTVISLYDVFLDTLQHDLLTWADIPLQLQLQTLRKACDALISPVACPACSSLSISNYTICHRCSCAIGCCTDCARTHFAAHKAECDLLLPIGILQAMTQTELVEAIEQGNKNFLKRLHGVNIKTTLEIEMLFGTWHETRRAIDTLLADAAEVIKETDTYLATGHQNDYYLQQRLQQEGNQREYREVKHREIRPTYWPGPGFRQLYISSNNLEGVMANIKENKNLIDITEGISLIKESSQATEEFLVEFVDREDENVRSVLEFLLDNKSVFPELFTDMIVRMRYAYVEQLSLLKESIMDIEEEILAIDYKDQVHRFEFVESVSGFTELLRSMSIRALPTFLHAEISIKNGFISTNGRAIYFDTDIRSKTVATESERSLQDTFIELTNSATAFLNHEMSSSRANRDDGQKAKEVAQEANTTRESEEQTSEQQFDTTNLRPIEVKTLHSVKLKPQIVQLLLEMQEITQNQVEMAPKSTSKSFIDSSTHTAQSSFAKEQRKKLGDGFFSYCEVMREIQALLTELDEYCSPGINSLCSLYKNTITDWPVMTLDFSIVEKDMQNGYDAAAFIEAKVCQISETLETVTSESKQLQIKVAGKQKQLHRLRGEYNQVLSTNERIVGQITRRNVARQDQYLSMPSIPTDLRNVSSKFIGSKHAKLTNYVVQDICCVSYKQAECILNAISRDKIAALKDSCGIYICRKNSLEFLLATGKYQEILPIYIRHGIFYSNPQVSSFTTDKNKVWSSHNVVVTTTTNTTASSSKQSKRGSVVRRNSVKLAAPSFYSASPSVNSLLKQHIEHVIRPKLTREIVDQLQIPGVKFAVTRVSTDTDSHSVSLYNVQSISARVDDALQLNYTFDSGNYIDRGTFISSPTIPENNFYNEGPAIAPVTDAAGNAWSVDSGWNIERFVSSEAQLIYPKIVEAIHYPEFISAIEAMNGCKLGQWIFTTENEIRALQFLAVKKRENEERSIDQSSFADTIPCLGTIHRGLPPRPKSAEIFKGPSLNMLLYTDNSDDRSHQADARSQSAQLTQRPTIRSSLCQKDLISDINRIRKLYEKETSSLLSEAENRFFVHIREEITAINEQVQAASAFKPEDAHGKLLELRYTCYKSIVKRLWQQMLHVTERAVDRTPTHKVPQVQEFLYQMNRYALKDGMLREKAAIVTPAVIKNLPLSLRNYLSQWSKLEREAVNLLRLIDGKIEYCMQQLPLPFAICGAATTCCALTGANSVDESAVHINFARPGVDYLLMVLFDSIGSRCVN